MVFEIGIEQQLSTQLYVMHMYNNDTDVNTYPTINWYYLNHYSLSVNMQNIAR
jgi:hypothetical protein